MMEKHLLPPLPESYIKYFGDDMRVELDSAMVAKMKTYMQQQGIDSGFQFLVSCVQGLGDPSLLLNVDLDRMLRDGATYHGMPQNIIREYADVKKDKTSQQQQQQQQAQAQLEESQARTAQSYGNAGVDVASMMGLPERQAYSNK